MFLKAMRFLRNSSRRLRLTNQNTVKYHEEATDDHTIVRRAFLSDYEKIINIRDQRSLYDGYDSLPDTYKSFLECPTNMAYVAMINGDMAGLTLVSLIDNGETVGFHGLRTSPRHQGKGIVKIMLDKIIKDLVLNGTANGTVGCWDGLTSKINAKSYISGSHTMIMERMMLQYKCTKDIMVKRLGMTGKQFKTAKLIHSSELEAVFSSTRLCLQLFPEDRLLKSWLSYRLISGNIPLITTRTTDMVGSNLHGNGLPLLTIGNYSNTFNGLLLTVNIFGRSWQTLEEHIFLHLFQISKLRKLKNDNITVEFTTSNEIGSPIFDQIMEYFGFEKNETCTDFRICCVEQNLK